MQKFRIGIIGTGNAAHHLLKALSQAGHEITAVYGRNAETAALFGNEHHCLIVNDISNFPDSDIIILAVSDDAIANIELHVPDSCLLVHCSGMADIQDLKRFKRYGVFYPLQTMSKHIPLKYSDIPFCIEANETNDQAILIQLAKSISTHVYEISSEQRRVLHLAAVFANNFSNAMYVMAKDICEQYQLPFELLKPLILETAHKAVWYGPEKAQTGPAKRGDAITMQTHLDLLNSEKLKEIYQLISTHITQLNQKKENV